MPQDARRARLWYAQALLEDDAAAIAGMARLTWGEQASGAARTLQAPRLAGLQRRQFSPGFSNLPPCCIAHRPGVGGVKPQPDGFGQVSLVAHGVGYTFMQSPCGSTGQGPAAQSGLRWRLFIVAPLRSRNINLMPCKVQKICNSRFILAMANTLSPRLSSSNSAGMRS